MKRRDKASEVDARLLAVRRALRERHAEIEPDALFVDRVIARLPREVEGWSFDWAARRVLPVSLAVAFLLTIAVLVTSGQARRAAASSAVASGAHAQQQTGSDPLEWLLEDRQEVR